MNWAGLVPKSDKACVPRNSFFVILYYLDFISCCVQLGGTISGQYVAIYDVNFNDGQKTESCQIEQWVRYDPIICRCLDSMCTGKVFLIS